MKSILVLSALVVMILTLNITPPASAVIDPGPPNISAQLGAISNILGAAENRLNNIADQLEQDPGPVQDTASLAKRFDAISNILGAAENRLNNIADQLEQDPGPVSDPEVILVLTMIVSQSNGIISTADQLEADPGPVQDQAALAALNMIKSQSAGIIETAQDLLDLCGLSGCP